MTDAPHISDEWIAERWPDLDRGEIRRRFNALMGRLGEGPWRGVGHPDAMTPVLAWAAMLPVQRVEELTAALADVPNHLRNYLWMAERPYFGEQRVKTEAVVGDSGHGMGRQAIATTPYIRGYNLARWIAAASPGNVGALLHELRRLRERVSSLLRYNNDQVEKRRAAATLLREAGAQFRFYEANHRAKIKAHNFNPHQEIINEGAHAKAERNAEIAGRIETFLKEIHQ